MRVLYMGTPECSAQCLKEILSSGIDVVGVVTQPDRPCGRNLNLKSPSVKQIAIQYQIPVYQPEKACDKESIDMLTRLDPDVTVVFAFCEFLSDRFLDIPKISTVNLHLSLLPEYRGAAPVQWSIVNGDKQTGATTFHIVRQMDAGDIIYQENVLISNDDTSATLTGKLTGVGSRLMIKTIKDLCNGTAPRTPQDHSKATRARILKKSDGLIDWNTSSQRVHDMIRGMNPWPSAYSFWMPGDAGKMLKFFEVEPTGTIGDVPGRVFAVDNNLYVSTIEGSVRIITAQLQGKKRMSGIDLLNGHRNIVGATLSSGVV